VVSLDLPKNLVIAVQEGARYTWRLSELLDTRLSLFDAVGVRGNSTVQLTDQPLIRVVALALRRDSAERPYGDGEREGQEQQARGEPQPAAGYFLFPLWPLPPLWPPPWSAGGPPPLAFVGAAGAAVGAAGAFLACPGGSPR
jgi:hypothetical protein